jgi:hypothetical protein
MRLKQLMLLVALAVGAAAALSWFKVLGQTPLIILLALYFLLYFGARLAGRDPFA